MRTKKHYLPPWGRPFWCMRVSAGLFGCEGRAGSLSQPQAAASSLPEGAFWSPPLLQYGTSSKGIDRAAVQTEAPSGRELSPLGD